MHIIKMRQRRNDAPIYLVTNQIVGIYPTSDNPMEPGTTVTLANGGSVEVHESCFTINCKLQEAGYTFLDATT